MKGLPYIIGATVAALSLTVGLTNALASNHSTSARTTVAVASSGLGRVRTLLWY
jgi:hypothetical protein